VVNEQELSEAMAEVALDVGRWIVTDFEYVRQLQEATDSVHRVDMMESRKHGGRYVAVKRIPSEWVLSGQEEFEEAHPEAAGQPWQDLGLLKELNLLGYPHVCELLGTFRGRDHMYVITSLATEGSLVTWCDGALPPGRTRESAARPLVVQVLMAVQRLHDLGVAHRDLSLENILLTDAGNGELRVKLIDFGMATLSRQCQKEVRGQPAYIAPEMHSDGEYDAFLTDAFALGVVIFAMTTYDYPWKSTRQDDCRLFEYASVFGLRKLLGKRKLRHGGSNHLLDVLSPPLVNLLAGLLEVAPERRLSLGEVGLSGRPTVWELPWLEGEGSCGKVLWANCGARGQLGGA